MTYSCGPLHIDEQRQDDQLEPIYNSSVPIQDVAWKTSQERWTIETGSERGSGRSVLVARHDDDNDDDDLKYAFKFFDQKTGFLPSSACVKTVLGMLYIDADKSHRKRARQEQHKNAMSYIEQILDQGPPYLQSYLKIIIYIYIYIYIYMLPHGGWALRRRNCRPPLA